MATQKKSTKIDAIQEKLAALRAKHAIWHPHDAGSMNRLGRTLEAMRKTAEFEEQPPVKKLIAYWQRSVGQINHVLLNDGECPEKERRILMEKREMLNDLLRIFVVDDKTIEEIEASVDYQLKDEKKENVEMPMPIP